MTQTVYFARYAYGQPALLQAEVEETPKTYVVRRSHPVSGRPCRGSMVLGQVVRKADLGHEASVGHETLQVFTTLADALAWLVERAAARVTRLAEEVEAAQRQREELAAELRATTALTEDYPAPEGRPGAFGYRLTWTDSTKEEATVTVGGHAVLIREERPGYGGYESVWALYDAGDDQPLRREVFLDDILYWAAKTAHEMGA